MPGFLSSCPNWLPPPPYPPASVPLPFFGSGGGGAHSLVGGGGGPTQTKEQKLWYSRYSIIPLRCRDNRTKDPYLYFLSRIMFLCKKEIRHHSVATKRPSLFKTKTIFSRRTVWQCCWPTGEECGALRWDSLLSASLSSSTFSSSRECIPLLFENMQLKFLDFSFIFIDFLCLLFIFWCT